MASDIGDLPTPPPALGLQTHDTTPGFYVGAGHLNSDPHTCMTGTLSSPQPLVRAIGKFRAHWKHMETCHMVLTGAFGFPAT